MKRAPNCWQTPIPWQYRLLGWCVTGSYLGLIVWLASLLEVWNPPTWLLTLILIPLTFGGWVGLVMVSQHFDLMGDRTVRTLRKRGWLDPDYEKSTESDDTETNGYFNKVFRRVLLLFDFSFVVALALWGLVISMVIYDQATSVPSSYYELTRSDIDRYENLQRLNATAGDYVDDENKLVRREEASRFDLAKVNSIPRDLRDLVAGAPVGLIVYLLMRWLLLGSAWPFGHYRK